MGLSASQARLLSLTARMTDNEMRSQMITNSKTRLADKSGDASRDYMNALNSKQLMFFTYDEEGSKTYHNLTPTSFTEYAPLKNQYGIINTAGHILVNDTDSKNYAASNNLQEFLDKYNLYDDLERLIDNPAWAAQAQVVYGGRYAFWTESGDNWLQTLGNDFDPDKTLNTSFDGKPIGGVFGEWIKEMQNKPEEVGEEPIKPDPNDPKYNLTNIWNTYKSFNCFGSVNESGQGLWHMEHVLCHLMHNRNESVTLTAYPGTAQEGTFTIPPSNNGSSFTGHGAGNESDYTTARDALKNNYPELYQQAVNLYYELMKGHAKGTWTYSDGKTAGAAVTDNGVAAMSLNQIYNQYLGFNSEVERVSAEQMNNFDNDFAQWEIDHDAWQTRKTNYENWLLRCEQAKNIYAEELANLGAIPKQIQDPYREINDKEKADWYTNLWYRMGGKDESSKNQDNFEVFDTNLINNKEWLQFALEQGVVTLEQVKTNTESADYPHMNKKAWTSIVYSSASDIREQEDSLAITRAEVKYNKALKEIEYKDKEYDQDLKKLDTEHSALQTEYDSLKSVIEKNTERSFKAFS